MNPFRDNPEIMSITGIFYRRFYNDQKIRKIILGINPGRLGAGATGIPFTDTKRLASICRIRAESVSTHEPSSVFVYDMIRQYGGASQFYGDYYITSMSPLGFLRKNHRGNWVNCNYYDDPRLFAAARPFIIESLIKQLAFGIDNRVCFVLGKKNAEYLEKINEQEGFFQSLVALEHPRYIEQYKKKERARYIRDYLKKLGG
jgi:hypothetical protein